MEILYKEADEESYSKFVRGKSKSQNRSDHDLDEADAPKVELESRIVTEVLSADLNPFNIEEKKDK